MPDIKKYSTGRLGNEWPRHPNTDHVNTKGLDNDQTPGIEAYIDEDIVRAYDDNRPIINLLANDEIMAGASDCLARADGVSAVIKNRTDDWRIKVASIGIHSDPEDFSERLETTPLDLRVCSGVTPKGGLTFGSAKRLAGFERNDGTVLWVSEHDWFYSSTPTLDDPNASYSGFYRAIYTDAPQSSFPDGFEDYELTVRQRYTTGAVYRYPIYTLSEHIIPYGTSIFNITNEVTNFAISSNYPSYDLYPETFVQLTSNNLGALEVGVDTRVKKNFRREEHKLIANEFNAESGVYKAELKSDVFRENKSNNVSRIENDTNFIRIMTGVKAFNETARVYFNDHKSATGSLIPLEDSRDFLGSTTYSLEVEIGNSSRKIIELNSPETRGYQDVLLALNSPNDLIINTPGETEYNFQIRVNNDSNYTTVDFTVDDPNLYDLAEAINSSFDNNNVYAAAVVQRKGTTYDLRIFSRSSGEYSKIEIQPGTSDLASNIGGTYGTSVDGIKDWYIYYNPDDPTPEVPPAGEYKATVSSGVITSNDFDNSPDASNIGFQLFTAMFDAGLDNFTVGVDTNVDDVHTCELYVTSNNASQGYIELNMSVPVPGDESGLEPLKTYYFQLNIDDQGFEEFSFTTTTDTTYNGVINAINNVLAGRAVFSIETTNEIRITSDSYGPQSSVRTANGNSGDSLFGAAYPAAGFTPANAHALPEYGAGDIVTIRARRKNTFAIFEDSETKRLVYSHADSNIYVTPDVETDIRDHVDTEQAYLSRSSQGSPERRWSTHNDKTLIIDMSDHSSWTSGATVEEISTIEIDEVRYLLVGNTAGQVFYITESTKLYEPYFLVNQFELLEDPSFSSISNEKINKFFKYIDGTNNREYLFVLADTIILFADTTGGLTAATSFSAINTSSSLSVPNVSDIVFSEIRDVVDWTANVSSSVSNNYLIFVGQSEESSAWPWAPILYALYDDGDMSFEWYAEEVYRKTQIDDITSITIFDGWQDPQQSSQVFITNNANGPEIWAGNSQNNDIDIGGAGDDKFNRFSWVEANYENGPNHLGIDSEIERLNFLEVYDDRIFVGGTRADSSTLGGFYSYGLNKLQSYYKVDGRCAFYDIYDDVFYVNTSEGDLANSEPAVIKISKEKDEGRAQIFSRESLNTVSNWPEDSAFRVVLTGFVVGGVNFDGEYNVEFNGQGKANIFEIVDAINGDDADAAGFKAAIDTDSGIANDISPVIRARGITSWVQQGNTYVAEYKIVIESKIPTDTDAGHSSTRETTQSNCSIEILFPTTGTTVVGTGNDTMEITDGTVGYANLQLVDWDQAKAYQLKRVSSPSISFSGNSFIDITPYVDSGYDILSGSLRIKTNENDELGFSQGRGLILKTNTPTGLADDSTEYGLKVTFNENLGPAGTPEITEVTLPADSSGSLAGKYWTIGASITTSPWTDYYIWYDVDRTSADPTPAGLTGIEVSIQSNATADEVAEATAEALNKTPDFSVSTSGDTITITNTGPGDASDAADVDSGVTVNVVQQGTDPGYIVDWVNVTGSDAQSIWDLVNEIDADLTGGTCTLQNLGATTEYVDFVITSDLVGSDSSVKIEVDSITGAVNLLGTNALNVIPNKSIPGSTALNTPGSQTLGFTWENADYFYEPNHPDDGEKRIYIPNGSTRIDPGATVWLDFWEWRELTKVPAKDSIGENILPESGEWTYDIEEKKVAVGDEPTKTFPQDIIYVDAKVEKVLAKLDLGDNLPVTQEDLSDTYHLTGPNNIENSEITLSRSISRISALHYGVKLWATDDLDEAAADYSFFLPRVDVITVRKESDYYGNRAKVLKGVPDPDIPYIELPLTDQDHELYTYLTFIDSADYSENNIVEIPWYMHDYLDRGRIFLDGNIQHFRPENSLISTRGLRPLRDFQKISKTVENRDYSLVRLADPINAYNHRKRVNPMSEVDDFYAIYVDVVNGSNSNTGFDPVQAVETLEEAVARVTTQRNTIIIKKKLDGTASVFPLLAVDRNFKVNIIAEHRAQIVGMNVNSEVYLEGIEVTGQTSPSVYARVMLMPEHKFSARYCAFNWIETQGTGQFDEGINIDIKNSTFLEDGILIVDNGTNALHLNEAVNVELDHVYFHKAKVAEFYPASYDTSSNNIFTFNNVTNGLNESGYIVDTDQSTALQFVFNRSLLTSGTTTDFASAAPIVLNETLTYTTTNNESHGTGPILSNNSTSVDPGDIDIITKTGASLSIARGYNKDSKAINYVDRKHDAGAFIEERFEDAVKHDEALSKETSYIVLNENRIQYRFDLNPEKFTFYLRFKPTGNFQQQGVLFDSRFDGDYNFDSSVFNSNATDFIQIVYDNKTYGTNYLTTDQYCFKAIVSNGQATYVAVIGPYFTIDNFEEFGYWHEIAIQFANKDTYNPKYDSASLTEDVDSNRKQALIYVLFDRQLDKIYALRNQPYEDTGGNAIVDTNWLPGNTLSTHFNIGGGWAGEWIDTPSGRTWSTWAESSFNMVIDDFLVSPELIPINILASMKTKEVIDYYYNDYRTTQSDDKNTILLNHCDNSHPFSENGIEPFDDYHVSFRPYEGYEYHALAIEGISSNFVGHGKMDVGQWYDRREEQKWSTSNLNVLGTETGDAENEFVAIANDGTDFNLYFVDYFTDTIKETIALLSSDEAIEAKIKKIGSHFIILYTRDSTGKAYFKTVQENTHSVSTERTINNATTDKIDFTRAHADNRIIFTYHEGTNGYAQVVDIGNGNIVFGRTEFADADDVSATAVAETVDEDGNPSFFIFFREAATDFLRFVMYNESLSTIILSHDTLAEGQWPENFKTIVFRNNNTLIKWKTPTALGGTDFTTKFVILSIEGAEIVSETDVMTNLYGSFNDDVMLLKDSNLIFSGINNATSEIEFKLFSQSGDELQTSQYLRSYDFLEVSDSYNFLTYPYKSKNVVSLFNYDSESYLTSLESQLPTRWYKDFTGVYDSFLAEVFPTKTFFGRALHMLFNHTTSDGETGIYIADAETNDLTQFTNVVEDDGSISVQGTAALHGTYGFQFQYNGTDSTLYAEEDGIVPGTNDVYGRFYMELDKYFSITGSNSRVLEIARFGPSTDPLILEIEFNDPLTGGDGKYKLRATTTSYGSDETTLSVIDYSTAHHIDIRWHNDASGGWEVWVDGAPAISNTDIDTTGDGNADYFSIGSQTNANSTPAIDSIIYYDDIRVDSSYIGSYTAGLGQGDVWTTSSINNRNEKHYIAGYYYVISGDMILELEGPAVNEKISIQFSEGGLFDHLTYGADSVSEIKTEPINWNGVFRFVVAFEPESSGDINIHVKTVNSDDDNRIDDFLVDNIKLEENEFPSSLEATTVGYIAYPVSLKGRGSAYFRIKPQFSYDTTSDHTLFQGTSVAEDGSTYTTHELYYDQNNDTWKLYLADAVGNTIEIESDQYGDATVQQLMTDLNERHSIGANWDVYEGVYELYVDGRWYRLTGDDLLPQFKNSSMTFLGNREDRQSVANSLFDIYRISDEPVTHLRMQISDGKLDPFEHPNKTNIGSVTVKSLSFYGLHESDRATIYGESEGENSRLVLEIGDDFDDRVVIRHRGEDIAFFGSGGLTVNGTLNAALLAIQATTTIASYDDHVTVRFGFSGVPPEYNDGYFEVERGSLTNSEIRFDESQDSWVFHDGTNDNISIDGTHIGTWKDDDDLNIVSNGTGCITFSTNSNTDTGLGDGTNNRTDGTERLKICPIESVFNDDGLDHDFRIESTNGTTTRARQSTHLLFADAAEKQVLIGRDSTFSGDSTDTGTLVVNWKSTIQSADTSSFGTQEFRNDSGLRSGWIGGGNGSNLWRLVSEIKTFSLEGIDFDITLSSADDDSFSLETAGGMLFDVNGADGSVEWDIESTQIDSWTTRTQGGVQWYLESSAGTAEFELYISSVSDRSFNLQTAGGIRFDINGTTTSEGSEDKFKVEISNTVAASYHVVTNGGVLYQVQNGFRIDEGTNGSYYHLDTDGQHHWHTNETSDDSIYISTEGGMLVETAGDLFHVEADSGIALDENSGSHFQIANNGTVDITAVNSFTVTENSGSSLSIANNGQIDFASLSGANMSYLIDGRIVLESANQLGSDITIRARSTGNIYIEALDDDLQVDSNRTIFNNALFLVNSATTGESIIEAFQGGRVSLFYDNTERFRTSSNGAIVYNILQVGTEFTGSEGTFQDGSTFESEGFINSPWVYTAAIESNERDSQSTGMFMNDGNRSTVTDDITFVTSGQARMHITGNTVTINDWFEFDDGTNVNEIRTEVRFNNPSDDKLVTEKAVKDHVADYSSTNSFALIESGGTSHNGGSAQAEQDDTLIISSSDAITVDVADDPEVVTLSVRYDPNFFQIDGDNRLSFADHVSSFDVGSISDTFVNRVRVFSADSDAAGFEAYGDTAGTGYVYVGKSSTHGGGIFYNGDGTPSFAIDEVNDAISLFRRDAGVDYTVAYTVYNQNDLRLVTGLRFNDNVNQRMLPSTNVSDHAGTATNEGIVVEGSFAAHKVYNAVWNDYAESFEFDKASEETPEAGYVYIQTENGLRKSNKRAHKATVGVYSDTYGMLMGSKGTIGETEDWNKLPIGLSGLVWVWTKEKLEIGDVLVADKDGFATKANIFDRIFRNDRILGKVMENSQDKTPKRIKILIK